MLGHNDYVCVIAMVEKLFTLHMYTWIITMNNI